MSTNLEFDGDCSVLPVWRPEGVFERIAAFKLVLHQGRTSFRRQTLSASREKSDVVRRAVARRQRRRQRLRFRP